jgi:hypothetical protein
VALPGLAQRRDAGERPDDLRGFRRRYRLQVPQAILTDGPRIHLSGRFGAREACVLDALAIALVPLQRGQRLQPSGGYRREVVQGGPERLGY